MYFNGTKAFIISFFVSLFTSIVVCLVFLFVVPSITSNKGDVVVPELLKSTAEQARMISETRGLRFVMGGEEESSDIPIGQISRQNPLPGSVVPKGTMISVWLSKGSSRITIPSMRGIGLVEATQRLSELGLRLGEVRTVENDTVAKDMIVSTSPPFGSIVEKGQMITIVVSAGAQDVIVPALAGRRLESARRALENAGLAVGSINYEVSSEVDVGIVISSSPRAGSRVKKGSGVNLTVATALE